MTTGGSWAVCEACKAPRSEQDMVCASCGYHFKTKPVPAYPSDAPPTRTTPPPTIVDAPRTISQNPPSDVTLRSPSAPPPVAQAPQPSRAAERSRDDAPRTLHSPSSPPVAERAAVPVATWTPPRRASTVWLYWVLGGVGIFLLVCGVLTFVLVRAAGTPPPAPGAARTGRVIGSVGAP